MKNIFSSQAKKEGRAKLEEATRAVQAAQVASQATDELVSEANTNVRRLRGDRERNGYAELFREVIQQPPRTRSFPGGFHIHVTRKK